MYGLLGKKLTHSYSPSIHKMFGEYDYTLFEKDENELEGFIKSGSWLGINVTVPYKRKVIPFLDLLDQNAQKVGAVNTVIRLDDGRLKGYNTDYYGFMQLVKLSGIDFKNKKILILGTGGASLAVKAACAQLKAGETVFISRSGEDNYGNLDKHADADIIINATPVGMYPDNLKSPVELKTFKRLGAVFDLIYNPAKTKLLLDAEEMGIPAFSGLAMLVFQAKRASELFLNSKISEEKALSVLNEISLQMKNIVLIGMPGCGKTTVGKLLAKRLGREFLDCDEEIINRNRRTPADIINSDGEEAFRKTETEVLADICKLSGKVIATGGGAVTKEENYDIIKQNSFVIFIKRGIELLPVDDRPLSQKIGAVELNNRRFNQYMRFSDYTVENMGTPQDVAEEITEVLKCKKY